MSRTSKGAGLAGRVALVTGASRGIGEAIARRLAGDGARVALVARSERALEALADAVGAGAVAIACDMRLPGAADVVQAALDDLDVDPPDILVNNAGIFLVAPAHETPMDVFREMLELNLTAPFSFVRAFLPEMRRRGRGHVVTVGSVADRTAFTGNAAYAASKYGLRGMHEVLRAELKGTGVRASLVSPGQVDTSLWDSVDVGAGVGRTPRTAMLSSAAVADAVRFVVAAPPEVNVDELRLSRT